MAHAVIDGDEAPVQSFNADEVEALRTVFARGLDVAENRAIALDKAAKLAEAEANSNRDGRTGTVAA